ncbi:bzip transcription factor [Colletotrichum scovillei]|uniref:Bzip transcription factor n=1 Tax=Colletotrichum scovillei TaxID=1209932 RepID=A0A9P7UIF1_9PEZI|nr:bzip transcription factor [Colletotrichum scovillei]
MTLSFNTQKQVEMTGTPTTSCTQDTAARSPGRTSQTAATSQRLKKREYDRKAQRVAREKTKNRIAQLESLVEKLSQQDDTATTASLMAELSRVTEQRNKLMRCLKTTSSLFNDHVKEAESWGSTGMICDVPSLSKPPSAKEVSPKHPSPESSTSPAYSSVPVFDSSADEVLEKEMGDDMDSFMDESSLDISQFLGDSMFQPDFTTTAPSKNMKRLAVLFIIHLLMRAYADPTLVKSAVVPVWYLKSPLQEITHDPSADYFAWPALRYRFAIAPHRYCSNLFWHMFKEHLRIVWPYDFRDCYIRNMQLGTYGLSPLFKEKIHDLRSWTMAPDFFAQFPELMQDIPKFPGQPSPTVALPFGLTLSRDVDGSKAARDDDEERNSISEDPSLRSVQLQHRQINDTIVPIRRDCPFSPWDELYITDFLQEHFNDLSTTDHCWIIKGVAGLHELLQRNISANPLLNVTIPTCIQLNVTSKGNAFSIDFSDDSYKVNGVDEDDFVLLTYVHLVCMTAAFFFCYPVILVLASAPNLCIMIDRALQEPTKRKLERWQTIFTVLLFAPLSIAGVVTGIIAMGASDHARTEHGIIGYITIGLAAISVPLYLYQKRLSSRPDLTFYMYRRLKFFNALDFLVCQAILLISGFALPDGIDDFGIMTICGTNTLSSSLLFSLGMIVSFVWNCAMATMTVQWLLERRVRGGSLRDRAPPWMLKILRKRSDSDMTFQTFQESR